MEILMQLQTESEIIEEALRKTGSTRRWLIERLKEYDVKLNDSMLSNRFTGRYKWKPKELKAINKILKLKLKVD